MRTVSLFAVACLMCSLAQGQVPRTFKEVQLSSGTPIGAGSFERSWSGASASDGVWIGLHEKVQKYPTGSTSPSVTIGPIFGGFWGLQPRSMDTDNSGNLYVGWSSGQDISRVSKYDPAGNQTWSVSAFGKAHLRVKVAAGRVYVVHDDYLKCFSDAGSPLWSVSLNRLGHPTFEVDRQNGSVGIGKQLFRNDGSIMTVLPGDRYFMALGGGVAWASWTSVGPLMQYNSSTGAFLNEVDPRHVGSLGGAGLADGSAVLRSGSKVHRINPSGTTMWTIDATSSHGVSIGPSSALLYGQISN